jgi:SH3-like domain-containing protein
MNEPVADPVFQENGTTISATCENDAGLPIADAGACASWVFEQLSEGPHTIVVSAPGFSSESVGVTLQGPAGCCGQGPAVDQTVTLMPSAADAGGG